MQSVFYGLIEDQTKSLMLASGSDDYVFRVISAPRVSEKKSAPSRSVICIVSALLGGMLGVFISLVRYKAKKKELV
jgi:LPS O-antigen subunit length determinant protein (WzzB/FepE family)